MHTIAPCVSPTCLNFLQASLVAPALMCNARAGREEAPTLQPVGAAETHATVLHPRALQAFYKFFSYLP